MARYDYKVVVCGCTKNSAAYIEEALKKMYNMQNIFKEFQLLVYENDSADDTVNILNKFGKDNPNFHLFSEKGVREHQRTMVIAHGRNRLLDYVNTRFSDYDYIIMADFDVMGLYTNDDFEQIFKHDISKWDVLTANCNGPYYDIWPLRIETSLWKKEIHGDLWPDIIDYDCWQKGDRERYVYKNQVIIPKTKPLIPVDSAFGGFGIYRMQIIKGCKYSGQDISGKFGTCEHTHFNLEIREKNKGRIFICPSFIVECQLEHVKYKTP